MKIKNAASRVDFSDVRGAAGAIIEHCRSAGGTTATAAKRVRLGAVHMATRPSNLERLVARESWEAELSVRPAAQAWCMKKLGRKTASCTHTHFPAVLQYSCSGSLLPSLVSSHPSYTHLL